MNRFDGVFPVVIVQRWPGVIAAEETDMDTMQSEALAEFDATLKEFKQARANEGANMKAMIEQRLDGIEEQVKIVSARMPEVIIWQREKLLSRFEEAKIELEEGRVEQEMIMLAQKVDVAEELDRLNSHIGETRKQSIVTLPNQRLNLRY